MKVAVLIMAGGNGTRLWPISNAACPKQFLNLVDQEKSMVEVIFDIAKSITHIDSIFVSTNKQHVDLLRRSVAKLAYNNIIVEPQAVGTMASAALANLYIQRAMGEAVVLVLSSDCVLGKLSLFDDAVRLACEQAALGDRIISLGVDPTQPHTGYGYMKCGRSVDASNTVFECDGYVEKPDRVTAEKFLHTKSYLWNAGIFAWHTSVFSRAVKQYATELNAHYLQLEHYYASDIFDEVAANSVYQGMHPISFDCAVMERIKKADVIKSILVSGQFDWADIGSYGVWKNYLKNDEYGNAYFGDIETDSKSTSRNCMFICQHPYQMAVSGNLDGIIISVSRQGDILLIPVDREQEIKKLLNADSLTVAEAAIYCDSTFENVKKVLLSDTVGLVVRSNAAEKSHVWNNISLSINNYQVAICA